MIRRHFTARLFAIAFVGTHIPLLTALLAHMALSGTISLGGVLILLGGTVVAAGFTLFMAREIRPIIGIADALAAFSDRQEVVPITHRAGDEVGQLANSARFAVETADRLLREASRRADTDPLTGLANRRAASERVKDMMGSLAVVDLDHFKAINDTFGHASGDQVLEAVAGIMRKHVRTDDVVARWGGEEFAIFLPEASVPVAVQIMERIRKSVGESIILPDRQVTLSGGITEMAGNMDVALRHADALVYQAKEQGRNRIVAHEPPSGGRASAERPPAHDPA